MEDKAIKAAVMAAMNDSGSFDNPRVVAAKDLNLSEFSKQESDIPGVEFEYVDQSGPGFCGDDYWGRFAVPLSGNRFFVVDYWT